MWSNTAGLGGRPWALLRGQTCLSGASGEAECRREELTERRGLAFLQGRPLLESLRVCWGVIRSPLPQGDLGLPACSLTLCQTWGGGKACPSTSGARMQACRPGHPNHQQLWGRRALPGPALRQLHAFPSPVGRSLSDLGANCRTPEFTFSVKVAEDAAVAAGLRAAEQRHEGHLSRPTRRTGAGVLPCLLPVRPPAWLPCRGVPLFPGGGRFPFSGAFWEISLLHRSLFEPLPYAGLLARAARLCRPPGPEAATSTSWEPLPPPFRALCSFPDPRLAVAPCPRLCPGHRVPHWWHVAPWPWLHCGPWCPGPAPGWGRSGWKLTAIAGPGASRPQSPPTRCPREGLVLPLSPGPCW